MKYRLILFLFFTGCSSRPHSDQNVLIDSLKAYSIDSVQSKKNIAVRYIFDLDPKTARKYLQGTWAKKPEENILFTIKKDSIYYFEDSNPVFYEIRSDTFYIHIANNFVVKNQLAKLTADSLIMWDNGELLKLYKRSSEYLKY